MKKYLPWMAVVILFMTLMYAQHGHREDQQELQDCYRVLLPEAKDFEPLDDGIAAARDASGSILAYVGVKSATGYGGPMLVGIAVHADGTMGTPVIFTHRETQAYLDKIEQQGFFKQFETLRADDALVPGFDIDGISGATLSSHAIALAVNEAAHAIATQAMNLTPRKAELPWRIGVGEISIAALFALGLIASTVKKLARFRLLLLGGSIVILGFWLNRSFSLAHALAACMGFFPDITRNLIWYIVVAGAVLPTIILGKNLYCTFICPFCGLQEMTHKISHVNLSVGPLMKIARVLRSLFLFIALFIGFLSLNPSYASYEPFGTIFGLNGENCNWYLLFFMLAASFFFHRFWCHVFCPAGALLDFIAARRRDAAKLCRRSVPCQVKPCKTQKESVSETASIPTISSSKNDIRTTHACCSKSPCVKKLKITKSQLLFILFYIAGLICIIWIVHNNISIQ